jgi:hypothetical protein
VSTDRPIRLSRRQVLGLFGGGALLAACGKTSSSPPGPNERTLALRLTGELYQSTDPQRFAFALWAKGAPASGPATEIGFKGPANRIIAPQPAMLFAEGLPPQRGIYVTNPVLDAAGTWTALIRANNQTLELPFTVAPDASTPKVGAAAPTAVSPTLAQPLGVDPICTQVPPCPLHTTSLSELIGRGRPVAVLFATPARCSSQYCGPVLDELLSLRPDYEGKVDFVHVEIYENNQSATTAPTVQAWGLKTEPWLFTIDGAGTVQGRLDGAFDRSEMRQLLDQLTT